MKSFERSLLYFLFSFKILMIELPAQSFQIYHQFGNQGNDRIKEIKALPDGSFIASGTFREEIDIGNNQFTAIGREDLWIARFDENFDVLWAIGGGSRQQDEVTDLKIASDGSIYWTGSFWTTATFGDLTLTPRLTNKSFFIIKISVDGEILNSTTLSGRGAKDLNELAIDEELNVFFVGNFSDTLFHADTFFVSNYDDNFFTTKMNAHFNIEWFQQVDGDGFSNGNAITLLPSGEIISAGEFRGNMFLENDSIETRSADEDVFFAKFSTEGNPLFLRKAGGVFPAFCKKAVSDSEGNFYLAGHHRGVIDLDGNIQIKTDGLDDNFYILAYREDGSAIWGKSYGSTENSEMTDLQLFDNQLFIAGYYDADMVIESQNVPLGDGFFNAFFAGFSKRSGSLNWIQTTTGNDSQAGNCIAPISATEVVGGFDFSNEVSFGNDVFSTNGFFDFFITKMNTPEPTSTKEIADFELSFYPNPTNDLLFISIGASETELTDFKVEMFSNLGERIKQFSNQKTLDLSFLPKGVFYLKVVNSEGVFKVEKFLKN